ncbi:MAG: bifunctional tetrahydrofolate synthase/dihydrofolate synthase [Gammaproteobacteria bacterium]|nr:bifunctional tetrahydrofolate synthase/dihydrofolate synthase [Gammaproteobacteria bacterium]
MRFSSLDQWLDWQISLHPKSVDLGLERVSLVWSQLTSHHEAFVITVAGTNGKGSSVAMLESILLNAGYRVGCFTSPHLVRYNERIKINGNEATDQAICEAFEAIEHCRDNISLTYFEFGALAALHLFEKARVEVMILEVGLGGRLDAVNIVDANAALITAIGIDHQDWLGNDREVIGREKAGIFRKDQLAVFSGNDMPESVRKASEQFGTKLLVSGEDYQLKSDGQQWSLMSDFGSRHALPIPAMRGKHQLENAAGVIALLLACREQLPVKAEALKTGLLQAQVMGRFQVLQNQQVLIVDVAHNPQSTRALAENLAKFVIRGKLRAIVGMLRDKDSLASLENLAPQVEQWFLVSTHGDRGLKAELLADNIQLIDPDAECLLFNTVSEAYNSVLQYAQEDDSILVTGSFHIAGEFLAEFG